jgi:hypothetical protein
MANFSLDHCSVGVGHKPPFRRRIKYNGKYVTRADVASISYSVYRCVARGCGTPLTGHANVALAVADVVSDELQAWDEDSTGYNAEVKLIGASPFTAWGSVYLVAVTYTMQDGAIVGYGTAVRTPM